jgi:Regulator of chromosome condensation (RCC1) repeat
LLGSNVSGQMSGGTTGDCAIPVVVLGLTGVTSVSTGRTHTCALTQGAVKCWGDRADGKLANGTTNGYSGGALTTNALSASAPRRTSLDLLNYLKASCGITPQRILWVRDTHPTPETKPLHARQFVFPAGH